MAQIAEGASSVAPLACGTGCGENPEPDVLKRGVVYWLVPMKVPTKQNTNLLAIMNQYLIE